MQLSYPAGPSIQAEKNALLYWASQFPYVAVYDNGASDIDRYGEYEFLLGVAPEKASVFTQAAQLSHLPSTWLMGILSYELKNTYEPKLHTHQRPWVNFPVVTLFEPEYVLALKKNRQTWECLKSPTDIEYPLNWKELLADEGQFPPLGKAPEFRAMVNQSDYLATIEQLRNHIKAGDFYEINLAQAFVAEDVSITPQAVFKRLMEISPVPFGAYIRFGEKHLICASPERFLQRQGNTLRSQPIKGTAPRSQDPQEDELHATYLRESLKERAENVMIVDLTRNDLNRSCDPFSVQVPHLFEIQAFPQVYQMVSTVEGQKRPEVSNADIWANTFPPGSMTGAPKVKTMEMIDYYEPIARGVYAGSAGYIKPNGDFDWNVIIRSLVYDAETKRLCYHVGGAITYDSDPAAEYAETLLKAKAIRKIWA